MYILSDKSIKNKSETRIKIYPDIMLAAARGSNGGAVRLYFLGKHYDQPGGYGLISSKGFRHWIIKDLKWKTGTYDRYLSEAKKLGIIERRGQGLRLAAVKYAALAVGCYHLEAEGLQTVQLNKFAGKRWLAFTYGAFMRRFNDHSIAAKTISELTGIPVRTIYSYDKLLGRRGIKKRRNYAYHKERPDPETIANYKLDKGLHVFKWNGKLMQRLPGQRFIYAEAAKPPKHIQKINGELKKVNTKNGQRKRINSDINAMLFNSSLSGGTKRKRADKQYIEDRNYKDRKEAERKVRAKTRAKELRGERVQEFIYRFEFKKYGTGFYAAI